MQNDHKTQDPGHSFGRSDDREKLATWPASLVSELAKNRRVRFVLCVSENKNKRIRVKECTSSRVIHTVQHSRAHLYQLQSSSFLLGARFRQVLSHVSVGLGVSHGAPFVVHALEAEAPLCVHGAIVGVHFQGLKLMPGMQLVRRQRLFDNFSS